MKWLLKSTPPKIAPTTGMTTSPTSESTILPKAAADDHAHRQIDDVALQRELLELGCKTHVHSPLGLKTGPAIGGPSVARYRKGMLAARPERGADRTVPAGCAGAAWASARIAG